MVARWMKRDSSSPQWNWRRKVGWGVPLAWLTLCVVWSSTWLVIKVGLRDLPPISYAAIRFIIAVIVLFAVSVGRVALLPRRGADYAILCFTGVLGWTRHCLWSSLRGVLQCLTQSSRDSTGTLDDRRLANDLRRSAIARHRIYCGRKSGSVSLERLIFFLLALSGCDRLGANVSVALLAVATHDGGKATSNLAHYPAWCSYARMGNWRRDIFPALACWSLFRPGRRVDDFPKSRDAGAGDSRRLINYLATSWSSLLP